MLRLAVQSRQRGFSIIELMIVLVVAAVLLSLVAPTFQTIVKNNRLYTQSNDLYLALMRARSEAMARVARVTLCPSSDGSSCSGTSWENGWVVFAEDLDSQNATVNSADGDELIAIQQRLGGNNTLRGDSNLASYVSYLGTGYSTQTNGSAQAGYFILCDDRGINFGKAIRLNAAGRPRVMNTTEDNSITSCTP